MGQDFKWAVVTSEWVIKRLLCMENYNKKRAYRLHSLHQLLGTVKMKSGEGETDMLAPHCLDPQIRQ